MSEKVSIYCEVDGLAQKPDGTPCPAGVAFKYTVAGPIDFDYDELVAGINLNAIADTFGVPYGSVRIITPEEYEEKYGDDDEDLPDDDSEVPL